MAGLSSTVSAAAGDWSTEELGAGVEPAVLPYKGSVLPFTPTQLRRSDRESNPALPLDRRASLPLDYRSVFPPRTQRGRLREVEHLGVEPSTTRLSDARPQPAGLCSTTGGCIAVPAPRG